MPDKTPASIGQILIFREEFEKFSTCTKAAAGTRLLAFLIVELLDELIARREAEGLHA